MQAASRAHGYAPSKVWAIAWRNGARFEQSMIIVVHASDCKAIQCSPIAQQSAMIVAMRPAQRHTMTRLIGTSPMSTLGLLSRNRRGPGLAVVSLVKATPTYYRAAVYYEKEPPEISHIRNYRLWIHSFRLCRRADRVSQFQ